MNIFARRYFSTVKEQLLKTANSHCNVPENITALLDRRLLAIENHPLSIIKEQIKTSLGSKFTVTISTTRLSKISVQ